MYLLFRYHNFLPSAVYWLPYGEKKILHAFVSKEVEDKAKEDEEWRRSLTLS